MEHGGGPCRGRLCAPSLRGIDGRKSASDGETAKGTAEAGPFLRHVFLSYPLNIPFRAQQLGQQDGAAGGAAQGVVGQAHELVVVLGIRAQSADRNTHAAL